MRPSAIGLALLALVCGCDKSKEPVSAAPPAAAGSSALGGYGSLAVSKPAPERVVAIGDLHGDLNATRRALRLAGAIDEHDAWIGGKLTVVQTGDEIDRGDDDRTILDLFERLKTDAPKSGGAVVALVGNHELMNDQVDFRYVTKGGFAEFTNVNPKDAYMAQALSGVEWQQRGRAAAFLPTGPYAQMLSTRPVIARVGDTIFAHGGVLSKYVKKDGGLDDINAKTAAYLRGERDAPPKSAIADDGPLWTRLYSEPANPGKAECDELDETLRLLNAKRMVMGHTVQKNGISPACSNKAWRIDVGMTAYYGGPVQVLELRGDTVTVLKEH
jgi:hypothetical protein